MEVCILIGASLEYTLVSCTHCHTQKLLFLSCQLYTIDKVCQTLMDVSTCPSVETSVMSVNISGPFCDGQSVLMIFQKHIYSTLSPRHDSFSVKAGDLGQMHFLATLSSPVN